MSKRITIYDIARELGVSTATVNRAMNNKPGVSEKTRQKVQETAKSMGFTVNQIAKSLARPPIRLEFLICNPSSDISFFQDEICAGVQFEAERLKDYNVSCIVQRFAGDPFAAQKDYIERLRTLIAEPKPDGILMIPTFQTNELYGCIRQLREAEIQVGLISNDLPGSNRLFACHQNAALAGRIAAELLCKMTSGGKVAAFSGHANIQDHYDSIDGFQNECRRRNMELIAVCESHDDPDFAAYNFEKLYARHPEIEGIYINSANSISICKKMKESGLAGRIRVITSDVFDELTPFIRENVVQATIFQDPFRQGRTAMKYLYRAVSEGVIPPSDILIRPQIVVQSNLDEFLYDKRGGVDS